MGRKRKANLEIEYQLERTIEDLKQENSKLKRKIREYEKIQKANKKEQEDPIKKRIVKKECPVCGASVKTTELPMGYLDLCESACGYRSVTKKLNKEG